MTRIRLREGYCQYMMEGEGTEAQCIHRDGYGPQQAYCKTHTNLYWPAHDTSYERDPPPSKPPKETPWAKNLLEPFIKWRTRKEWPVGSVLLRRNNSGQWTDKRGHVIRYGLGTGTADYIGFKSIVITPEMVGKRVAVFTSIEAKRDGVALGEHQHLWHETVLLNGGISMRAAPETKDAVLEVLTKTQAP